MSLEVPAHIIVPHDDYAVHLERLSAEQAGRHGRALYTIGEQSIDDLLILREFRRGIREHYEDGIEASVQHIVVRYPASRDNALAYIAFVNEKPAGFAKLTPWNTACNQNDQIKQINGYNYTWFLTEPFRGQGIGRELAPIVLNLGDGLITDTKAVAWQGEAWTAIFRDNAASQHLAARLGFTAIGEWQDDPDREIYTRL